MDTTRVETVKTGDPLRRDLVAGGIIGFLLIVATLVICYLGVSQINTARDAQSSLDQSERYVQGVMRGLGELILAEGASEQIKALESNLRKSDDALKGLAMRLPDDPSRAHFAGKIQPAWKAITEAIRPFAARRGVNASDNEVMAAYGKMLSQIEAFEADFVAIEKAVNESVAQTTRRAYGVTAAALGVVLVLFILLNMMILRRLRRGLGGDLSYAIAATRQIAQGDLSAKVELKAGGDASLLYALKAMNEQLTRMVNDIRGNAESIRNAAEEVAAGNNNLSQRTEEQASTLEETASSMEQFTAAVRENTDGAQRASDLAKQANQVAVQGGEAVSAVVVTMNEIQQSSKKIGDIISVIDSIAFQTNILALNAAVEAARAGEQGRGFAVVAAEVRGLAQRSADAAKEIKVLIGDSVQKVETGTRQVENAGKTMNDIVVSVEKVTGIIHQISVASREQASGIEQVNNAVSQMDQVVQQNAAVVEQAAAAAESLHQNAQHLYRAVGAFKLGDWTAGQSDVEPSNHQPPSGPEQTAPAYAATPRLAPGIASARKPVQVGNRHDAGEWKSF
jgi:methyl-accepting chemotaxis protein